MKKLLMMVGILAVLAGSALAFEDVMPQEAYGMATADASTYILDVRTLAEWQWVGHPGKNKAGVGAELDGKVVNVSYKIDYKGAFVTNPSFLSDVQGLFPDPAAVTLITMCRSGQRSYDAAVVLEAAGYTAKNMLTGFQGGSDTSGYRTKNGWVVDGLPYTTSGAGYTD